MNTNWNLNMQTLFNIRKSNIKADGVDYEYNRSLQSRVRTAYASQERRKGLTKQDDLTVNDVADLIFEQNNTCPICGYGFNGVSKKESESYNFDIAHIVSPEFGGLLTKSNIQLLHKRCNSAASQDSIDFNESIKDSGMYFLDMVIFSWQQGNIDVTKGIYKRYFKLARELGMIE